MRSSPQIKKYKAVANEDSMVVIRPAPKNIIVQSNLSGQQVLPPQSMLSYLTSLCNCFRVENASVIKPENQYLLTPQIPECLGRNTLVLDLDETLVHSTFEPMDCDISLAVEIEGRTYNVSVLKRPGVDQFLQRCCELFEVVVFTASLKGYADPLLDVLDTGKMIHHRLSRESCSLMKAGYVKDLNKLGRDIRHSVIIDVRSLQNSPTSYCLQPMNALPIKTWINDKNDNELEAMIEMLEYLAKVDDIPKVIKELTVRKLSLDAKNINKLLEAEFVTANRGAFNSPVNSNSKTFKFGRV